MSRKQVVTRSAAVAAVTLVSGLGLMAPAVLRSDAVGSAHVTAVAAGDPDAGQDVGLCRFTRACGGGGGVE
jgi:hypothetical protein